MIDQKEQYKTTSPYDLSWTIFKRYAKFTQDIAGFDKKNEKLWDFCREACRRVDYYYLLFDRSEKKKRVIFAVALRTDQIRTLTVYRKQSHCGDVNKFLYLVRTF